MPRLKIAAGCRKWAPIAPGLTLFETWDQIFKRVFPRSGSNLDAVLRTNFARRTQL